MKAFLRHFMVHLVSTALCLIVLGVAFIFLRPQLGARASHRPAAAAESEHAIVELDEFIINLADTDRARYIKVSLALDVTDAKTADRIKKESLPRVRDAIIMTLAKQYFQVLSTNPGKQALKRQLVAAVNQTLPRGGGKVADILFMSLVMQ